MVALTTTQLSAIKAGDMADVHEYPSVLIGVLVKGVQLHAFGRPLSQL